MRKFSIYFACFFTLALMGCGDTSGNPTARIALEADKTDIAPGSSAVITATVTRAVGTKADATTEAVIVEPGWGENVTFRLLTANGGQLSTAIQKTDGDGKARTVYTAGNNFNSDTVHATLDNGMSASIVIKKSGTTVGAIISSFVASPAAVAEGQTSVITAKVTDGNSANPKIGEAVTFTLATNESGACFINASNACVAAVTVNSDAGGNAVAIYRAGGNQSTETVYDTVRGSLSNGSSNAAIITRSPTAFSIAVTALPATVDDVGGGSSIITAKVTSTTGSTPTNVSGVTVAFTTAGGGVSPASATTDGSGNAVTTFSASAGTAGTTAGVVTASVTIDGVIYRNAVVINYQ